MGHVPDLLLDGLWLLHHIVPPHPGASRRGTHDGAEYPQGGALPGPVGPKKTEDLPLPNGQVHLVDSHQLAKTLSQAPGLYRQRGIPDGGSPSVSGG